VVGHRSFAPVNMYTNPQTDNFRIDTSFFYQEEKMGKPRDTKKDIKKKPSKTIKEKRKEKREKKT
jgi:hypothetical protein